MWKDFAYFFYGEPNILNRFKRSLGMVHMFLPLILMILGMVHEWQNTTDSSSLACSKRESRYVALGGCHLIRDL